MQQNARAACALQTYSDKTASAKIHGAFVIYHVPSWLPIGSMELRKKLIYNVRTGVGTSLVDYEEGRDLEQFEEGKYSERGRIGLWTFDLNALGNSKAPATDKDVLVRNHRNMHNEMSITLNA